MSITQKSFGTLSGGEEVFLYEVDNGCGLKAEFLNLGCIIKSLCVTHPVHGDVDVVLGRDSIEDYEQNVGNLGATVGRYANRIRFAEFEIDGRQYLSEPTPDGHLLHSGKANFAKRLWEASYDDESSDSITFRISSPDGDNGFPGDLDALVTFTLDGKSLVIHYEAVATKDTILNFTNHSYFNLNGHNSGDVLGHELRIDADYYTPMTEDRVPSGEIVSVKETPFDFTASKVVGADAFSEHEQTTMFGSYDHNFVLRGTGLREVACLKGDKTGISMTTSTDKPGLQLYLPLFMKGDKTYKDSAVYNKCQGICLETQFFPGGTCFSHFPSSVVRSGDKYDYTTVYAFDF